MSRFVLIYLTHIINKRNTWENIPRASRREYGHCARDDTLSNV